MTGQMLTAAEFRLQQARAMPEAVLQSRVEQLATLLGWLWYHPLDNKPGKNDRRQRVTPGFPDLVLVRGGRLLWRELKTHTGRVSPEQRDWHVRLAGARGDVAVWRPLDYLDGTIEADLRRAA